jgi:hypothetical protein
VTTSSTAWRALPIVLALVLVASAPRAAYSEARVHRFTLVVGANSGGTDRVRLQYAVTDAERFARVLVELGGVQPADEIILRQPRIKDLVDALDRLTARVADARRSTAADGGRTEVVLYYSGHADEQGLLIGADRYSYRTLRERLEQIPADVRMVVLDACASGAFTRIKSGKARPAFMVDQASNMRGHAFLTSSAASEAAQESDRIRASYFTHYLISGFRGAADLSGDGRVTLNEAYQFAFNETLGRTVDTKAGPQHPSYDINLSGTGDVVMTDLRQTTATLVLAEELDGRIFVRNAHNELIVELFKARGRRVELAVEPGTYLIRVEAARVALLAKAEVADGARLLVDARQFGPIAVEAARRRGDAEAPRLSVNDRNRMSLLFGMWRSTGSGGFPPGVEARTDAGFGGLEYTRYIRENLSVGLAVQGLANGYSEVPLEDAHVGGSSEVVAVPVIARWNPFSRGREHLPVKPFLAASVGPVFGSGSRSLVIAGATHFGSTRETTMGGHVGGGVDLHLARPFAIGLHGGYYWMLDFSQPVGLRSNYSGPQFAVSLGWMFGRGRAPN